MKNWCASLELPLAFTGDARTWNYGDGVPEVWSATYYDTDHRQAQPAKR